MSASKEAELVTAVMLYAVRCFAEGDLHALKEMNFGPKELGALREISMSDLFRARELTTHCLQVRLNREIYWPMLDHLRREREAEGLQRELVQADAPLEMLQALFGTGAHEYTRLRRMLTLEPAFGRTPEADEAQATALWAAWKSLIIEPTVELTAMHYLNLHHSTGISLRIIWNQVQRWRVHGAGDAPHEHPQDAANEATD
jgi:Protein of unknown function (DUF2857)